MTQHSTAAVIGGGIAGMAAAYELMKAGFKVTVFETRDRVGGRPGGGPSVWDLGAKTERTGSGADPAFRLPNPMCARR